MDFYIKNKSIKVDKNTLPDKVVGDNTGYIANFIFDDEWEGMRKTARFIGKNGYVDKVLTNDSCEIPLEVLKSGLILVGAYAGNLKTTTPVRVAIIPSILDKDGLPADPTPDVYAQIIGMIQEIRDNQISDEEIEAAVSKYMDEHPANTVLTVKTWTNEDFSGSE